MSCRTTSGGSVSTSLARMVSGLPDKDIQHLFHALKREGAGQPAPSELALSDWRERQQQMLDRATRMTDKRRDALRRNLFRSREEPVPDGEMFYAWSRIEARARQEAVVRSIDSAVDLAPPGSQADQYELGPDGRPVNVMYASYGSNLHRDRFMTYIQGGTPTGSRRNYPGCSDTTEPEFDIPIRYHGGFRAHFALTSSTWRGGIAFMDQTPDDETATALGRAYKLPIGQFDEVVHFENGGYLAKTARPVPLDEVLATGRSVTGEGVYETMVHIGDYEGMPVLTFTAPFSVKDALGKNGSLTRNKVRLPVMTNKPSAAYCRMIGNGLQETFGVSEVAAADYLRGMPGGEKWSRADLVAVLREPEPVVAPHVEKSVGYTSATSTKHRENSATYMAPNDLKSWVESQHAANGQARRPIGATNGSAPSTSSGDVPLTSRWDQLGSDNPDKNGNYLPDVKTYATGSERDHGVNTWAYTVKRAKDKITHHKRMVDYYESRNLPSSAADARNALARAESVHTEAKAKHVIAKAQQPASYYPEASAYYPGQWSGIAERTKNTLAVAEAELRATERAANPSKRRIANLTKKVETLTAQHTEAQTKAEEAGATARLAQTSVQANVQATFDAGTRSPSRSSRRSAAPGPRVQPGMHYLRVKTYTHTNEQLTGLTQWQRTTRDAQGLVEHSTIRHENAIARHAEQPSKFSEEQLAITADNLEKAQARHKEATAKRDEAAAQTPTPWAGNKPSNRELTRRRSAYQAHIEALETERDANSKTANLEGNGSFTRQHAAERVEDLTVQIAVLHRAIAQMTPEPKTTTKTAGKSNAKSKTATKTTPTPATTAVETNQKTA